MVFSDSEALGGWKTWWALAENTFLFFVSSELEALEAGALGYCRVPAESFVFV